MHFPFASPKLFIWLINFKPIIVNCCRTHHFPFPAVIPHLFSLIPLTLHFVTCKHVCCLLFPFFFSLQTDLLFPNLSKISLWLTFSGLLLFVLYFPREFFWDAVKSIMFKSAWCLCQELASASSTSCPWHTVVPSCTQMSELMGWRD